MKTDYHAIPESAEELREQYVELAKNNMDMAHKIKRLESELRLFRKKSFQSQSEKFSSEQKDMFQGLLDELAQQYGPKASEEKQINVPAHKRTVKKDRSLNKNLERVDVNYDLDESQKQCACGKRKKVIGVEVSEQLAVKPQEAYVLRHCRKKYGCDCGSAPVRAQMPRQPIPKSQFSPILLAWIIVSKYIDGLPLYRLSKILMRHGMKVCHKNMARALVKASDHICRLTQTWSEHLDKSDIRQCDETALQVLREPGRSATTKSWLWIQKGGPPSQPVILINYSASRAGDIAKTLFNNFRNGYLVVDGYGGYKAVAKDNNLKIVNCMDHARRKFREAWEGLSPKQRQANGGVAKEALERFKQIYAIERVAKDFSDQERKEIRQEEALPRLNQFKAWIQGLKANSVFSEKTKTAVNYFLNNFTELCQYCEDGRLPISNIATEHVAKQIALARKAFLFSCTPSGADATAAYFSAVLTAQANGLNPFDYLTMLFTELPKIKPGDSLDHLQPWNTTKASLDAYIASVPKPR